MPERLSIPTSEDQYGPYYKDPNISSMYESFPSTNSSDNSQKVPQSPQVVEVRSVLPEMDLSK